MSYYSNSCATQKFLLRGFYLLPNMNKNNSNLVTVSRAGRISFYVPKRSSKQTEGNTLYNLGWTKGFQAANFSVQMSKEILKHLCPTSKRMHVAAMKPGKCS